MGNTDTGTDTHRRDDPNRPPEDVILRMRREHGIGWHREGGWCRKFPGDRNRTYFGHVTEGDAVRAAGREQDRRAGLHKAESDAEARMTRLTCREAANVFLSKCDRDLADNAISMAQRASYGQEVHFFLHAVDETDEVIVGPNRPLSDLCKMNAPDQIFRPLRAAAMKRGTEAGHKSIVQIRRFLDWCSGRRRFISPAFYADGFDPPRAKEKRAAVKATRREKGTAFWTPDLVREIVGAAKATDVHRYAMVLLTLNGGMGATDLSNLEDADVNLDRKVIETDRSKTLANRVVPLWDETVEAMKASRDKRSAPADPAHASRFFLTPKGRPLVIGSLDEKRRKDRRTDALRNWFYAMVNPPKGEPGKRGRKRLPKLPHAKRFRGGYYSLRAVTATLALGHGQDRNLDAVLLGQQFDRSILANYVRGDLVEKLRKIVNHVYAQIWPDA